MLKKTLFFLFALSLLVICNCDEVEKNIELPVPFHYQDKDHDNYCGIACIQMWSEYDWGAYIAFTDQESIADALGIGDEHVAPRTLETGISEFTNSMGYLAVRRIFEDGAQGDLIAAMITGIDDRVPSIIPFMDEDHAALVKGAKWKEDIIIVEDERRTRPLAISITVHDPRSGKNITSTADLFRWRFMISNLNYWTILGDEDYLDIGTNDHNTFVRRLGTYYGGPMLYDPKDLLPPDIEIY
ncbi:MAG: hypothetical protein GY757_60295 [bacterium]|nr:hypothetical protein [bacterium]